MLLEPFTEKPNAIIRKIRKIIKIRTESTRLQGGLLVLLPYDLDDSMESHRKDFGSR